MIASKARFRAAKKLQSIVGYRIPEKVFSGPFLEVMVSAVDYDNLDYGLREQMMHIFKDFLDCRCRDSPMCGCPERKFTRAILELRMEGLDHRGIAHVLLDEYGIELYPMDIMSFLEESVHVLEAVRDVAEIEGGKEMVERTKDALRGLEG